MNHDQECLEDLKGFCNKHAVVDSFKPNKIRECLKAVLGYMPSQLLEKPDQKVSMSDLQTDIRWMFDLINGKKQDEEKQDEEKQDAEKKDEYDPKEVYEAIDIIKKHADLAKESWADDFDYEMVRQLNECAQKALWCLTRGSEGQRCNMELTVLKDNK